MGGSTKSGRIRHHEGIFGTFIGGNHGSSRSDGNNIVGYAARIGHDAIGGFGKTFRYLGGTSYEGKGLYARTNADICLKTTTTTTTTKKQKERKHLYIQTSKVQ